MIEKKQIEKAKRIIEGVTNPFEFWQLSTELSYLALEDTKNVDVYNELSDYVYHVAYSKGYVEYEVDRQAQFK